MKKVIIGLVGEIASGKDTVALYLKEKYGSETISFSQPLRDILDILYLSQNRKNLAHLGADLRARFGQNVLAKTIFEKIKAGKKSVICLPNIRLNHDIELIKKLPGFVLVGIFVDPKIRYQRLKKRRQNPDDKTKTWPQFLADAKLPTEIGIRKIANRAKFKINNNGNLKQLYEQIEKIITKVELRRRRNST